MEKKALSILEAAKVLGVSPNKLYQMCKAGQIPCRNIGRKWLIPVKALDGWLEGGDHDG